MADALKKTRFRKTLAFFRETRAKAMAKASSKGKAAAKPKATAEAAVGSVAGPRPEGAIASSSSSSSSANVVAAPKAVARAPNLANQVTIDGVTYVELWRHAHTEFHGYTFVCPTCHVPKDLHFLGASAEVIMTQEECRRRLVRWSEQSTWDPITHRKRFGRNLNQLAE